MGEVITLQTLGRKLREERGDRGIREVASEISISPATMSRVERGKLPDLETFRKICDWLKVDPGSVLGTKVASEENREAAVHFRMEDAVEPETAKALAEMILAAQRAFAAVENG